MIVVSLLFNLLGWVVFSQVSINTEETIKDEIVLPCGHEFKGEHECDDRGDVLFKRFSELRSAAFTQIFPDCPVVKGVIGASEVEQWNIDHGTSYDAGDAQAIEVDLYGILSCDCLDELKTFFPPLGTDPLNPSYDREMEFGCLTYEGWDGTFLGLYTEASGFTECVESTIDGDNVVLEDRRFVELSLLPSSLAPEGLTIGRMCAKTFDACDNLDLELGTITKSKQQERAECPFLESEHRGGIEQLFCSDAKVRSYYCQCPICGAFPFPVTDECDDTKCNGLGWCHYTDHPEECPEDGFGRDCYKDSQCVVAPFMLQILCDIQTGYFFEWYDQCDHTQYVEADKTRDSKYLTYHCWTWVQPNAADTVFLMDSSNSIRQSKWRIMRNFIRTLAEMGMHEDSVGGVVTFADEAHVNFEFGSTKEDIAGGIDFITKIVDEARTNTYAAFDAALTMFEQAGFKGRPRTIVFITDGLPTPSRSNPCNDDKNTMARLNAMNVNILTFVIGVNEASTERMNCLWDTTGTTALRQVVHVPYFDNLQKVVDTPECFDWALSDSWLHSLRKKKGGKGELKHDPAVEDCDTVTKANYPDCDDLCIQKTCRNHGTNKCMYSKRQGACVDFVDGLSGKHQSCSDFKREQRCNDLGSDNMSCEWVDGECTDADEGYGSWEEFQLVTISDFGSDETACRDSGFTMWVQNQCWPLPIAQLNCAMFKSNEEYCSKIRGCKYKETKRFQTKCKGKPEW